MVSGQIVNRISGLRRLLCLIGKHEWHWNVELKPLVLPAAELNAEWMTPEMRQERLALLSHQVFKKRDVLQCEYCGKISGD